MVALIVDDAVFMRMALKNILLKDCGIDKADIYEANNGDGALKLYRQTKPEIVFLDVQMPGQSGPQLVEELMKIDPNAKIIMCALVGRKAEMVECADAGARGYIKKPPQPERVIQAIEHVTGRKIKRVQPEPPKESAPANPQDKPAEKSPALQAPPPVAQEVEGPSPEEQVLALKGEIDAVREEVLALKQLFESIDTGGAIENLTQEVIALGQLFEGSDRDKK
ncbi:MAG: response regulator [Oscillospiraceae bacterium]|nr:response regulator [Oscillospiraceae bacterium]